MKKLFILGMVALLVFPVLGVSGAVQDIGSTTTAPLVTIKDAVEKIFNAAFWLLLGISAIFFLMGAYYFLTAGTSPDAATKGKNIITYAIVAIVIAILAKGIAAFLPGVLGV
ncbi:MAG: hypothetical protein WBK67_02740 [Minisyncoccales bacterium]|jgi:heme/copper-type cytochrome/quinol oxidase subunit 4